MRYLIIATTMAMMASLAHAVTLVVPDAGITFTTLITSTFIPTVTETCSTNINNGLHVLCPAGVVAAENTVGSTQVAACCPPDKKDLQSTYSENGNFLQCKDNSQSLPDGVSGIDGVQVVSGQTCVCHSNICLGHARVCCY